MTLWLVSCPRQLDKVAGLDEHAAGAASGIEHDAVIGFDGVDEGLHQRGRGEEFAAVLRALHRELHQEILVNAAEHIAAGAAQRLAVEGAQQVFQQIALELVVILRQLTPQRLELLLDGVHRLDQRRAQFAILRPLHQRVVSRGFGEHQGPALDEVALDQRPFRHLAGGLIGFDLPESRFIAVAGMAQEDHAQHRHTVFAAGQFGVGAKLVGGFP